VAGLGMTFLTGFLARLMLTPHARECTRASTGG
jgi:hypothetical protein